MDLLAITIVVGLLHAVGVLEDTESARLDVVHLSMIIMIEVMEDALHHATMARHLREDTTRIPMTLVDPHLHQFEAMEIHMHEATPTVDLGAHPAMAMPVAMVMTNDATNRYRP